ncbi:MAG: hypothetical protein KJO64_00330 [Bacteroidia bacterium]|nr:hypothetical protein [Bacteroidia bacterium]
MIKFSSYLVLLILGLLTIVHSCKHDPVVPQTGDNPLETSDSCYSDTVYFVNDVLPILVSNCALSGCHDPVTAEDNVILNNYNNMIQSDVVTPFDLGDSDLYEAITETDPDKIMPPPPASPLSADQINTISTWINQGAKNNFCEGCDTTAFTFAAVIEPIINSSCTGCHSGATPSGYLTLVDYNDVQAIALNGSLEGVITGATGFEPMPFNANPLPDCKITQIINWINDGAPNN